MKRRDFIKTTAVIAATTATGNGNMLKAAERISGMDKEQESEGKLIVSAPMLQNFAATSMGVVFAVSALANGYVLVGEKPDLSDARKVLCGGYRVTDIDDRVIRVRLTGLKPATRYYYRIGADRISYKGGYQMKILGNEEDPNTYSFMTAGEAAEAHFCVINDTHARWEPFGLAVEKIAVCAAISRGQKTPRRRHSHAGNASVYLICAASIQRKYPKAAPVRMSSIHSPVQAIHRATLAAVNRAAQNTSRFAAGTTVCGWSAAPRSRNIAHSPISLAAKGILVPGLRIS